VLLQLNLFDIYRMKNFSLVSGDSVRNSQLNSSTAKHSFVFSKE
jgi:hypothetical protein